jgi:hypothetical protein
MGRALLERGQARSHLQTRAQLTWIGSSRCRIAVEEWLPKAHAAAFTSTVDRSVGISSRGRPTVTGEIETLDGASSGTMSAFCDGNTAVIAVGLAKGAPTSARHAEMASLVSSFGPLVRVEPTPTAAAVKTPARKKKPPVRPTRRPSPVRTVAPEPEPAPVPKATAAPEPTERPEPTAAPEPVEDEILPMR